MIDFYNVKSQSCMPSNTSFHFIYIPLFILQETYELVDSITFIGLKEIDPKHLFLYNQSWKSGITL